MNRQSISGGGWLDLDTADSYDEAVVFDGRNQRSVNTGSEWAHEHLYRTKRGTYVLHHWSQCQGSTDTWTRLDVDEAVAWLLKNDHEPDTKAELASAAASEV